MSFLKDISIQLLPSHIEHAWWRNQPNSSATAESQKLPSKGLHPRTEFAPNPAPTFAQGCSTSIMMHDHTPNLMPNITKSFCANMYVSQDLWKVVVLINSNPCCIIFTGGNLPQKSNFFINVNWFFGLLIARINIYTVQIGSEKYKKDP